MGVKRMTKDEEKSRRIFLVSRFIGDGIMRDEEKRLLKQDVDIIQNGWRNKNER